MIQENLKMDSFLSEYWGDGNTRRAAIHSCTQGYFVELFENEKLVETRNLFEHSRHYAEDCAENWVQGIF